MKILTDLYLNVERIVDQGVFPAKITNFETNTGKRAYDISNESSDLVEYNDRLLNSKSFKYYDF